MPAQRLTKKIVETTEPGEEDIILTDSAVPGLHVKITPAGKRIYAVLYRNETGQRRRPKIGEHGAITLDQARDLARQILGEVAAGNDPSAARQQLRRRLTVAEFWDAHLPAWKRHWKPATISTNTSIATRRILPEFGPLPMASLTRPAIYRWHQSMAETPRLANVALKLLRTMLNRARELQELTGPNPADGIKLYRENSRETFLTAAQLRAVLDAIDEEEGHGGKQAIPRTGESTGRGGKGLKETSSRGITPHCAALFRLLIYTGARRNEIQTAEWSFVDWEAAALRLPDSKTGKKTVWLNTLAMEELRRLHAIRTQDRWIIEGRLKNARLDNAQKPWDRVRRLAATQLPDATLNNLRLHDLRHSFASFAAASGVTLQVIGKALGHAESRTTERYAHILNDPVKAAAELVADRIRTATTPQEEEP